MYLGMYVMYPVEFLPLKLKVYEYVGNRTYW